MKEISKYKSLAVDHASYDKIDLLTKILEPGDKFHVPRKMRHQMYALENSELFEFSTQHFDEDSHRIFRGD